MNLRRIFANAVARRVAALLVAAVLAWLGLGEARAQALPAGCTSSGLIAQCQDQPAALAAVKVLPTRVYGADAVRAVCGIEMLNTGGGVTSDPALAKSYRLRFERKGYTATCPSGWGSAIASWPANGSCISRPSFTSTFMPKSGSVSCLADCEMAWYRNSDSTSTAYPLGRACTNAEMPQSCTGEFYWNASLNVCEPTRPECEAGEVANSLGQCAPEPCPAGMAMQADGTCAPKAEECPAGNVKAPSGECLPGDGQCAVGEARRDNGTCGKDSDGDGKADEDDDNPDNDPEKESASGGDDCNAPPSCSGSAIACMQVKIQWRIDCNTRRSRNVAGGSCAAMPVCTGEKCDALEYASLLQQWRAACHLEKLANATPGEGGTPGGDSGAMDPVGSGGVLGDDLDPSAVRRGAGGGSWDGPPTDLELNEAGYGFGRACPTLPTISVMGQSLQFDTTVFCDWMRLGGVFVLIMAHLAGLTLVIRSI